jgi:hypothetical protein
VKKKECFQFFLSDNSRFFCSFSSIVSTYIRLMVPTTKSIRSRSQLVVCQQCGGGGHLPPVT